jgi:acetyl esterase/lipase
MVFRRTSLSPFLSALAVAVLAVAPVAAVEAAPMKLADYLALGGPQPSAHIAYGAAPSQYAELFLPKGDGPFPVVVLVHGGCWTVQFGGIEQMHNVAGALAASGIAVWNVEYRRVEEGGRYPGMYLDMEAAIASLAAEAPRYHLDTRRIVAVGHSAGGQLVQWIAGRGRLPAASPLYQRDFLPIHQIVSLGGLADLRHEKDLIRRSCDRDVVDLTGQPSPGRTDVYADTDAAGLMPNGSTTVLINGEFDRVSPPQTAAAYAALARQAGDRADTLVLPDASHYDEVAATSPSWRLVLPVIQKALGLQTAAGAAPDDQNPPPNETPTTRRQE